MLKIYRKLSLCLAFCVLAMPLFGDTSHQMTGVTAIPNITIDPSQLIFGEVDLGMTKELPLTVDNGGSSDIHVSALQLTGRDANNFSIYSGNAPFTLSPGATHVITIQFEPLLDCLKIADLNIISDDPVNGTEVVPLSGKGCGADIWTNDNGQFGEVFGGSDQDKSIHNTQTVYEEIIKLLKTLFRDSNKQVLEQYKDIFVDIFELIKKC